MGDDQVVIDVIDNGGQWTHREWRMLRYLGVETQILPNNTPIEELRELDGLILSGGAARVGLTGELGNCADYLSLDVPILGICAGHQFMARHYGGDAGEAPKPEFGAATISLVGDGGPLFEGLLLSRQYGRATTTRSQLPHRDSSQSHRASHARYKPCRTRI